jgi:predicted nucleic acid-binding protein
VRLVIADTGPVNYLLLIGHIEILPALFEKVILPSAVKDELVNPDTPLLVRNWIAAAPLWVEVRHTTSLLTDRSTAELGPGETEAITLAAELHADLLLMDDRRGVVAALKKGLTVTGTMGLLARAAKHGIINLADAFDRLKLTNFRYRQETMDALLREAAQSENG